MSDTEMSRLVREMRMTAAVVPTLEPVRTSDLWSKLRSYLGRLDWRGFLSPRSDESFGGLEAVVLFSYGLLLAWVIPHHEAWFDEAQAWLIARDSSLVDLVVHRLHYEGSPALWHLMLWVEVRLGISFLGMHFVTGAAAVAGVYVWLRYSRLPRVVTLLTPFTFYVIYQYAVVAREYVLAPLFIFALTAMYANRRTRPWIFAVVAGLCANCSLHMASIATGLAVLYGADRWRNNCSIGSRRRFAVAALLLVGFLVIAAATAAPTLDGSSTTANPLVQSIRRAVSGKSPKLVAAVHKDALSNELMDVAPAVAPIQGWLATRIWLAIHRRASLPEPRLLNGRVLKHGLVLLTAITAPISTSNLLSGLFLILLCVNLARARMWLALLPYCLLQLCNVLIAGEAHHIGLTWILLLAVMWMLATREPDDERDKRLRSALYACLFVIQVLQIGWSEHALSEDLKGPYSGAQATAAFLQTLPAGERIAAFDDDSVTVNAYLQQRPYFNQKVDYWPFSRTKNPSLFLEETMAERPDMVTVKMAQSVSPVMDQWVKLFPTGTVFIQQDLVRVLKAQGYRETHRFCGSRFYRNTSESLDCRLVYERVHVSNPAR